MNKEEFISVLRTSTNFYKTHIAADELDPNTQWDENDAAILCDIAAENFQVYGTLAYRSDPDVRNIYKNALASYTGPRTEMIEEIEDLVSVIDVVMENEEVYTFLQDQRAEALANRYYASFSWHDEEHDMDLTICDGLYHANSVSTALSYVRNGMLYSREYGDANHDAEQTDQRSDDIDMTAHIYNDIFFDNCDIRAITGLQSAYGPISFVYDDSILRNASFNIRITKSNPLVNREYIASPMTDRYFDCIEEMEENPAADASDTPYPPKPFRTHFDHHTTLWNLPTLPFSTACPKYILIERHENLAVSLEIKSRFEQELAAIQHGDIPVILRPTTANALQHPAAPLEELWHLPE